MASSSAAVSRLLEDVDEGPSIARQGLVTVDDHKLLDEFPFLRNFEVEVFKASTNPREVCLPKRLCVYRKALSHGMTLPLHPFVVELCNFLGISPICLMPNSWPPIMVALAWCLQEGLTLTVNVFLSLFDPKRHEMHVYFSVRNKKFRLTPKLDSSIKD